MSRALFALLLLAGFSACGGDGQDNQTRENELAYGTESYERSESLNVENISSHDTRRSHNEGLNCVSCHQELGPGKGLFTVAGTILGPTGEPLENAVVELHSAPLDQGGEPVITVYGDLLGNFFTTEEVPLPSEKLFVRVRSEDGELETSMPFPISNGSCNHCHTGGFAVSVAAPMGFGGHNTHE